VLYIALEAYEINSEVPGYLDGYWPIPSDNLFKLYSMNSGPLSIKRFVVKACCVHLELSSVIIITKKVKTFNKHPESLQVALSEHTDVKHTDIYSVACPGFEQQ